MPRTSFAKFRKSENLAGLSSDEASFTGVTGIDNSHWELKVSTAARAVPETFMQYYINLLDAKKGDDIDEFKTKGITLPAIPKSTYLSAEELANTAAAAIRSAKPDAAMAKILLPADVLEKIPISKRAEAATSIAQAIYDLKVLLIDLLLPGGKDAANAILTDRVNTDTGVNSRMALGTGAARYARMGASNLDE